MALEVASAKNAERSHALGVGSSQAHDPEFHRVALSKFGVAKSSGWIKLRLCDPDVASQSEKVARILEYLQPDKAELLWLILNPLACKISQIVNEFLVKNRLADGEITQVKIEFLPNSVIQDLYGNEISVDDIRIDSSKEKQRNEVNKFHAEVLYPFGVVVERENNEIALILNGEVCSGLLSGFPEDFSELLEESLRELLRTDSSNTIANTETQGKIGSKRGANVEKIGLRKLVLSIKSVWEQYSNLWKNLVDQLGNSDRDASSCNPQHHRFGNERIRVISDMVEYYFFPEAGDSPEKREMCYDLVYEVVRNCSTRGSFGEKVHQLVSGLATAEHFRIDNDDPVGSMFQSLIDQLDLISSNIKNHAANEFQVYLDHYQSVRLALGVAMVVFMLSPHPPKVNLTDSLGRLVEVFSLGYKANLGESPAEKTRCLGLGIYLLIELYSKFENYGLSEEILRRFGAWFIMSVCPEVYNRLVEVLCNSDIYNPNQNNRLQLITSQRGLEREWYAAVVLAERVKQILAEASKEALQNFGDWDVQVQVTPSAKGPFSFLLKAVRSMCEATQVPSYAGASFTETSCGAVIEELQRSGLLRMPDTARCRVVVLKEGQDFSDSDANLDALVSQVAGSVYNGLRMYEQPSEHSFDGNPLGIQLQVPGTGDTGVEILVMSQGGYLLDTEPWLEDGRCNPGFHPFYRAYELARLNHPGIKRPQTVLRGVCLVPDGCVGFPEGKRHRSNFNISFI